MPTHRTIPPRSTVPLGLFMKYGRIKDQEYWNCDAQNLEHAMLRGAPPFDSLRSLGHLTDQRASCTIHIHRGHYGRTHAIYSQPRSLRM